MADFDDQLGAPLGREKTGNRISQIFPSSKRLRRIQDDRSLDKHTRTHLRVFVVHEKLAVGQ